MKYSFNFYEVTEKDISVMCRILRTSFVSSSCYRSEVVFERYNTFISSSLFPSLTFYQDYLCRRAIITVFKACDCISDALPYIDDLFNEFKKRGDIVCK